MKIFSVLFLLVSIAIGEQTNNQATHLYVIVPCLSEGVKAISIWECKHKNSPIMETPGDLLHTLGSTWNHFHDFGGLSLEQLPELLDYKNAVDRVHHKALKTKNDQYPPVLLDNSAIWNLDLDLAAMPTDLRRDFWVLQRYLDRMTELYGTNICVEAPVPPRIFPGIMRIDNPCVLFLRYASTNIITAVHHQYLDSPEFTFNRREQKPKNANVILEERWREYFDSLKMFGINFKLQEIDVKNNLILISGTSNDLALYEKIYKTL